MMGERRGPTFDQTVTGPGCPEMNIRFVDPVKSSRIGGYHIFRMRGSNELRLVSPLQFRELLPTPCRERELRLDDDDMQSRRAPSVEKHLS
jgi:hypothetical protein